MATIDKNTAHAKHSMRIMTTVQKHNQHMCTTQYQTWQLHKKHNPDG